MYDEIAVCVDCYSAFHYGAHEHNGEWFAGESDTPCDRKPLALVDELELVESSDDNTGETFSRSGCSGCGSQLGGSRFWLRVYEKAAS